MTVAEPALDELITRGERGPPNDRIELRDGLARLGVAAIDAVSDWLLDPELSRFALRVIGRAGLFGARDAAIRALVAGRDMTPPPIQAEIDLELGRLHYTPPKPRKPSTPSWAMKNPYDVAPLSAQAGLSWPGFQPRDFDGVAGTSWRRPRQWTTHAARPLRLLSQGLTAEESRQPDPLPSAGRAGTPFVPCD